MFFLTASVNVTFMNTVPAWILYPNNLTPFFAPTLFGISLSVCFLFYFFSSSFSIFLSRVCCATYLVPRQSRDFSPDLVAMLRPVESDLAGGSLICHAREREMGKLFRIERISVGFPFGRPETERRENGEIFVKISRTPRQQRETKRRRFLGMTHCKRKWLTRDLVYVPSESYLDPLPQLTNNAHNTSSS